MDRLNFYATLLPSNMCVNGYVSVVCECRALCNYFPNCASNNHQLTLVRCY